MKNDNTLAYQVQMKPSSKEVDWTWPSDLTGPLLLEPAAIWPCSVALNPDGRLEVFIVGQDHHVYNQWQVDAARPDVWSDWVNLGGREIQPGLGIGKDDGGELNVFVIGGDNKLYFADRGVEPSQRTIPNQIAHVPLAARTVQSVHEGQTAVWYSVTTRNADPTAGFE
jgi:hypothetical protein